MLTLRLQGGPTTLANSMHSGAAEGPWMPMHQILQLSQDTLSYPRGGIVAYVCTLEALLPPLSWTVQRSADTNGKAFPLLRRAGTGCGQGTESLVLNMLRTDVSHQQHIRHPLPLLLLITQEVFQYPVHDQRVRFVAG